MRTIPWIASKWLFLFIFNATILGSSLDYFLGNKIDYWIHDIAVVLQARTEWNFTGIVVLDTGIPIQVSRKQALPLFAKATENLIAAGAKGIYLDANLTKENEGIMPYAICVEDNGEIRWSQPNCLVSGNQCQLTNSAVGNAPLSMSSEVFSYFRVAPYLENQAGLPDFLLYDWENEAFIPNSGLVALNRLITKNTPIARWMDLSHEHANVIMAQFIDAEHVIKTLNEQPQERCDQNLPCRRIRFSHPQYAAQLSTRLPIIPVSQLANCDRQMAIEAAALLKDRIAILQLTTPTELTDAVITPMTTALFGPYMLTPGTQYLVDSIETLLSDDHPREPNIFVKLLLFICAAIFGVLASTYLKQLSLLWGVGILLLGTLIALCSLMPTLQLWPVTVTMLTFITAVMQTIALHLMIGFKEGQLILQYVPKQVHNLIFSLSSNEFFKNQRYQAIVLMSDLRGYTSITGMLKEPMHILNLMNDYLDQTTLVLQDKYEGWLETYIGDMVCYYWPYKEFNETDAYRNALLGAIELSQLQKRFFSELLENYKNTFEQTLLQSMQQILSAGIGLSSGSVVMGDLGPKRGVRKFGILGDPMNLTARIESLTRHFNTEIIITEDFVVTTQRLGLPTRRLGYYCVKGRKETVLLYALGAQDDPRFQPDLMVAWESWLTALEKEAITENISCPHIFRKDQATLIEWHAQGLLKEGIWYLEEK
ncbi:adenylate cyclase [Nitrosomonas sp. Nm84]|uniref:adenylate/guanylate cyclase domain-containing protein n=1 Tax=Nitrosomonas sp. Nm84 TaxID=200124 RepID=UPI000D76C6FD|nr:adenylate/guanylate cyclase domain-containing protein [Nitrosomonas sp. Nm84]PXW79674.1 adenylate cyclase [Nitrosomonas sp. Nm84]